MRLFSKHATLHCVGHDYNFDVTVTADEQKNSARFQFKSTDFDDYNFPSDGLIIYSNLKGDLQKFDLHLITKELTDEMTDCLADYVKKFDFSEYFGE